MSLLEMHGVVKHYRRGDEDVVALAGVDLTVDAGELVVLVGRSGSGKSTLLHLAGGLDVPDEGVVRVAGQDLAALSAAERARARRQDIGFVFQLFHLLPALSVAENVELPLLLDGRRRRRSRVNTLLERVGVAHRADHLPGELSGGEMQRAAIARALMNEPRILLADEPTGNLDAASGQEVVRLLRDLNQQDGLTIIMVTHNLELAAGSDRVVRLVGGKVELTPSDPIPTIPLMPKGPDHHVHGSGPHSPANFL